mgnify:CR=1 FL=1
MIIRTFKFALYPNKKQKYILRWTLQRCCELYNAALEHRIGAYKRSGVSITGFAQGYEIPEIRKVRTEYKSLNSRMLHNVLAQVDNSFRNFFRRPGTVGFPKFKSRKNFSTFTYNQNGYKLDMDCNRLYLDKIGTLRIRLHRQVAGKIKEVKIVHNAVLNDWSACLVCELSNGIAHPKTGKDVGIDVGLTHFATTSAGEEIGNPRFYRTAEKTLRVLQRSLERKTRGSKNWNEARCALAAHHKKISDSRKDFAHKISTDIVRKYDMIVVEDLNVRAMVRGRFAKSILDAGWSQFTNYLEYKSEECGRDFMRVNPYGTSQRCVCGEPNPKSLKDREHICTICGLHVSRDQAAAMEILRLGQSQRALT